MQIKIVRPLDHHRQAVRHAIQKGWSSTTADAPHFISFEISTNIARWFVLMFFLIDENCFYLPNTLATPSRLPARPPARPPARNSTVCSERGCAKVSHVIIHPQHPQTLLFAGKTELNLADTQIGRRRN